MNNIIIIHLEIFDLNIFFKSVFIPSPIASIARDALMPTLSYTDGKKSQLILESSYP